MVETGVLWTSRTAAEVPSGDAWLTPRERALSESIRFPRRRRDFRLDRWAAKCALMQADEVRRPDEVAILPAPCGAPEAWRDGARIRRTLSIAHADGTAVCSLGPENAPLGVCLVQVSARTSAFLHDCCTENERRFVRRSADEKEAALRAAVLWSGKKAAFRALHQKAPVPLRGIEVSAAARRGADWSALVARAGHETFTGWWKPLGPCVLAIVEQDFERIGAFPVPIEGGGSRVSRR